MLNMTLTLGSLVCDVFLGFSHFSMWCPGSGVVLDRIHSWSLSYFLLVNAREIVGKSYDEFRKSRIQENASK